MRIQFGIHFGESARSPKFVILSDRRESKDLRTDHLHSTSILRRSFDALRLLRMTDLVTLYEFTVSFSLFQMVLRSGRCPFPKPYFKSSAGTSMAIRS